MKNIKKKAIEKVYAAGSNAYDNIMTAEWEFSTERENIFKKIGFLPNQKVLEVCVGTGINFPFYPNDCEMTGIDLTPEMLNVAQIKAENYFVDKNIRLLQMDAEKMKFYNDTFDIVFSTYGLCVVPDPLKVLSEMKRVVSEQGKIVLYECTKSDIPHVQKNQEMIRPYAITTGIPAPYERLPGGAIIWDPTRDFAQIGKELGLICIKEERVHQYDMLKSRIYIEFIK